MTLLTPTFNDAKTYDFGWLRYLSELSLKEGVVGSGDMKVTAAAGGGMKVDIAAGTALVKGDSGTPAVGVSQGLYLAVNDASVANAVTLASSDGTNPRIDQICLRVRDSTDLATGADDATFVVVTGTPTSGATLDNRNGAAALPNDYLRLADILVPAGSSSVSAGNVRDRRPWARGFFRLLSRSSGSMATSSGSWSEMDTTNLKSRFECAGNLIRVTTRGKGATTTSGPGTLAPGIDGVQPGTAYQDFGPTGATGGLNLGAVWLLNIAAGSHLLSMGYFCGGGGTLTVDGNSTNRFDLVIEEMTKPSADNA